MPFNLSATAPVFQHLPQSSSSNTMELLANIVCRKNEDIGTYEGGVLRPRKGVTSLIAWEKATPLATDAPPAQLAGSDEIAIIESPIPLVGTGMNDISQTQVTNEVLDYQRGHDLTIGMDPSDALYVYHYRTPPSQLQDMSEQTSIDQPIYHPAPVSFHPRTYQPGVTLPCDIAVAGVNRPAWNPAYHKAMSPSIERANRVVEEFKIYFGDGRAPDILIQLQKICLLCGLCTAHDLPETRNGCFAVRSGLLSSFVTRADLIYPGPEEHLHQRL